ncbi:MAG: hypothetical protein R2695_10735 [Acidimicrobiales bacterium]
MISRIISATCEPTTGSASDSSTFAPEPIELLAGVVAGVLDHETAQARVADQHRHGIGELDLAGLARSVTASFSKMAGVNT